MRVTGCNRAGLLQLLAGCVGRVAVVWISVMLLMWPSPDVQGEEGTGKTDSFTVSAIDRIEFKAGMIEGWLREGEPWVFHDRPVFTIYEAPRPDRALSEEERRTVVTADRVSVFFVEGGHGSTGAQRQRSLRIEADGNVVVRKLLDKEEGEELVIEAGEAVLDMNLGELVFRREPRIRSHRLTTGAYEEIIVDLNTGKILFRVKKGEAVQGVIRLQGTAAGTARG